MRHSHSALRRGLLAPLLLLAAAGAATAATEVPTSRSVVTQHVAQIGGKALPYTAWVEDNFVNDSHGKPGASVITVAYTRSDAQDAAARPVLFAFNGGPGAAAAKLNFEAIGPVHRVHEIQGQRGSGQLENNPGTLLDKVDLVFLDPVGTGFSRAFSGEDAKQWYSLQTDADSVRQAIEHWLSVHHRLASPRFLLGESYGTLRAGLIAGGSRGLKFDGVILVALYIPATDRLMPYVSTLPTMAAGAWYHNRIPRQGRTVEQVYEKAVRFARTEYVSALIRGSSLPAAERRQIATRMAALIGLPVSLIEASNLRIEKNTYMFNLLKGQHLRTGLLDVRVTGPLVANADGAVDDPALGVLPPRAANAPKPTVADMGILENPQVGEYIQRELHFPTSEHYYAINFVANGQWRYGRDSFDTIAAISRAMKAHAHLRLMWVQGIYDLTCPAYMARFVIDQDGIPPDRLTALLLPGPHSGYSGDENMAAFTQALRGFLGVSGPSPPAPHR